MKSKKQILNNPEYYVNRELSWLQFNERVLSEASDKSIPILERLKFLSITASNLDEFFMVRVASLKDMVNAKYKKPDMSGMRPEEQLLEISKRTHEFVDSQYDILKQHLTELRKSKIVFKQEDLTKKQQEFVDNYFMETVYPELNPILVNSSQAFPVLKNKSLNIGLIIVNKGNPDKESFATVQVPTSLPRLVEIPSSRGMTTFMLLEQIIDRNIEKLFINYDILTKTFYRIMRNADISIEEDDANDLLSEIQKQLKKRQWGEIIRLDVDSSTSPRMMSILLKRLGIKGSNDVYEISGPIDISFLMKLSSLEGFDHLRYDKYMPKQVPGLDLEKSIFDQIRERDYLLHHPYQTFDPVLSFVEQAANDKDVLSIRQTLYRVSSDSPIISSLIKAAKNGKAVTVLVELKARFDEENNILWAKKLEDAGCFVIYGLVGLKTHCKLTLVRRSEGDIIRNYTHLGTGNYNDATAKVYTDLGILTSDDKIGQDAVTVFNLITGESEPRELEELTIAPIWLRDKFLALIKRETLNAKNNKPAHIIAKMNSLCDKKIITELYNASMAGVKIDLIVRGICSVKVGIPEVSENITVRSIVGNFLEHSRVFYFENGGNPEVYMGSSDWMPRNLDKRVEVLFPVKDERIKEDIINILNVQLQDTVKAFSLLWDGKYYKPYIEDSVNSQELFCNNL